MTTLLLVRHGETDWNAERRWQGHADVPLNARGRAQARELAEALVGEQIDAIYTSDLSRAHATAEIVGARLGVQVVTDPDLREIDVGSREGCTGEIDAPWDGEETEAHAARILEAVHRIAAQHPDGRVLVVTHGGSMRRVHEHLGLEDRLIENCVVWTCAYEGGVLRPID
ncbi:MAG: histidine phosphatase family protein [Gaiellaceae bacterium]